MKSKCLLLLATVLLALQFNANGQQAPLPRLYKQGEFVQLLVDNKPYLILGGELGNSSVSDAKYLNAIWPKLKQMNLNTVIAPAYWELMEPTEGHFNFTLLDELLKGARANHIKIILLWFGSWKNLVSCYAPAWVKTNEERFPRVSDSKGNLQEVLTPFSNNNLEADKSAFVSLMKHLKQTDSRQHTVIMVQVENEMGIFPDTRSFDPAANKAFAEVVPAKLINYLQANKNTLLPEIKAIWEQNGYKTEGNWEDIFGKGYKTDELFSAWYLASYVNKIATAGKSEYNLPMYLNTALIPPNGHYGIPSGGPMPEVMDVWKSGAPAIDILAPDFYNPNLKYWCDLYTRDSDPLFIPEIRFEAGDDAKAFFVFGHYNCLSFSPFSIESTDTASMEPIGKAYKILNQLTPLITKYGAAGNVKGFLFDKDSTTQQITLGNYIIIIKHEYTLGWSPGAKNEVWPKAGGLIIRVSPDEFYVAGTGIVVTFQSTLQGKKAGLLSVEEGSFQNSTWHPGRRMNGDQDHQGRHVRIPVGEYGIQQVKLYDY